jgi:hypothetical protein
MEIPTNKIQLSVLFNTVRIELVCAGDYDAQVLFDDLIERLKSGERLSINLFGSVDETS